MINNVVIGQYYPVKSIVHNLDPRTKIICLFVFIMSIFISNSFLAYLISFLFIILTINLSNIPIKLVFRSLKSMIFLIFFTLTLNICFSGVGEPLFSYGIIMISKEGIIKAVLLATRLIIVVLASSCLTLTTSPIRLTDGIEYLLKPLKVFKVPAHEIAMMLTISLRFIPTLIEELDKIMKAQMSRGASFDNGSIINRAKALVPVLVPLFVSSFRRADELAMAMESRCYRGDIGRTRMKELIFLKNDYTTAFIVLVISIIIIVL